MIKCKLNDIVEVEWIDAFATSEWLESEKAQKRPNVDAKTIGYFLKIDDEMIYMSNSVISSKERDLITIPLGCIKKARKLK